jgi:hypothetical protein
MLQYLMARFGFDFRQWSALTRALIKKDFRESPMSTTLRYGRSGGRTFLVLIFFYLLTGCVFVPVVLIVESIFVSTFLLTTYTMFMIGGLILVEYHTVIISPDDYLILGFRPVSSRTFFVVKLTNVLFYVLVFSTVLSAPGIVTMAVMQGFKPFLALVAYLSLFAANFVTVLAIVLFYTLILRKVSLGRLQNILALFQVILSFAIYSSIFILPRLMESAVLQLYSFMNSGWLLLCPSSWFSSYVKIAAGKADSMDFTSAALSVLGGLAIGYFSLSRISIGYAESLAMMASETGNKRSRPRKFMIPFMLFAKAYEERVVSKLIRNQFMNDNKFKMAVLGILPLTIFYLFVGIESGPLPDPFLTPELQLGRSGLLYLLIFLFPMMLRTFVTCSDSYQASWIFYSAPANIKRLILAEKNFLMVYFVLPFLIVLGMIFYYFFGNLLHVLLHILVLGLLAHLFLQLAFLYSPDLPFSRPNVKGSRSRNLALFLILIPFVIFLILPSIFRYVYSNTASYLIFTLTVFVVSILFESLIQVRVTFYMRKNEFVG